MLRSFSELDRYRMDRWYSPILWFIWPVWSWMGWILALIVIIMIIGAISSITTTSFAVEKKIVSAVLTTDQDEKKRE